MAYVAITDTLRQDVRSTLNNMYTKELTALGGDTAIVEQIKALDSMKRAVDESLWGEFFDLKDRLDKLSRVGTVPVTWSYAIQREDGSTTYKEETVTLENVRIPIVVKTSYYGNLEKAPSIKGSEVLASPLFMELRNLRQAQYECRTRWDKVIAQVMGFIDKCKSLNEAVKLWPDLRRYIPKSYLDRLDFKPAREKADASAAAEALKNLDMDAINTSTVLARMAGGTV